MALSDVVRLLQACIEASIYIAPTEPGLTINELSEIGKRLGLREGEIGDALPHVAPQHFGQRNRRLMLPDHMCQMLGQLALAEDPDLRVPGAFDFVVAQLNELVRDVGSQRASLHRSIMVERSQTQSISRHHVEVAIALMVLSGQLIEKDRVLTFPPGQRGERQLPSTGISPPGMPRHNISKIDRTRAMQHVKDVIDRRADGRPKSIEPLDAFIEQLEKLQYGHFRLWWSQTVAELRRADPGTSPLSTLVLAAALVEGALTFVVKHAQECGVGTLGSTDFTKDPKTWKIDELVNSAARGGETAILDLQTKNRADGLIRSRNRIHAGRMVSAFPKGLPDLRPEEAREATAVAEQVVRRVLDWLEKYPVS